MQGFPLELKLILLSYLESKPLFMMRQANQQFIVLVKKQWCDVVQAEMLTHANALTLIQHRAVT